MSTPEYEHSFIAISGPMGIGKTTVAKLVAAELHYYLLEEKLNPFVADATRDPDRYAFVSEISFLTNKYNQVKEAKKWRKKRGVVQDVPVYQDVYSYGRAKLQGDEWELFHNVFLAYEPQLMKPSLIVCLEANALVNMERIIQRGRDFEKYISPEDLQLLTKYNYEWIADSGIPTVYIQTDHLDIVNSTEAKKDMMMQIRAALQK